MPPGCQLHATPRLHNQAQATPRGAKMAPCNVSPVSSDGHLSQGIIQEHERGYKKAGREDVELECMMMGFNEYCFFDHKILPLLGGGVKDRGLWKREEPVSDLCETYPCHGAAREEEVRKFLLGPLDSISFDLSANPDWVCTWAAHPSCFYTAVSVPQSHKAYGGWCIKSWRGKDKKKKDR